ncbi:hypothetical protein D3C75_716610 [compost metagenome]
MSTELLFEKLFVATLLLSVIPGFIWGWIETRRDGTVERIFLASLTALVPPCVIATIVLVMYIVVEAIKFIFS